MCNGTTLINNAVCYFNHCLLTKQWNVLLHLLFKHLITQLPVSETFEYTFFFFYIAVIQPFRGDNWKKVFNFWQQIKPIIERSFYVDCAFVCFC